MPTYAELYSGDWKHTTYSGCVVNPIGKEQEVLAKINPSMLPIKLGQPLYVVINSRGIKSMSELHNSR